MEQFYVILAVPCITQAVCIKSLRSGEKSLCLMFRLEKYLRNSDDIWQ